METFLTGSGEYTLLYRSPGALLPEALPAFRAAARAGAQLLYADEFLLRGKEQIPVYKPVFSPDTLLSYNYIGSPVALSTHLYEKLGGSFDTPLSQYDLTLRAVERADGIVHVPEILYAGPAGEPVTSERALRRALNRRHSDGVLSSGQFFGSFRVRYGIPRGLRIGVILVYTGDVDALRRTLESVAEGGAFLECHFYICYGCLPDQRAERYFRALSDTRSVKFLERPGEQNAAKLKNLAAERSDADALLFLEPGMEPESLDALEEMASQAIRPSIGCVGAKIVMPDRRILHAGLALGLKPYPVSLFAGKAENTGGALFDRTVNCIRNVSAVGGGALMIARETFFAARHFDETVPDVAVDADLCLRCARAGLNNLYDPYAVFCAPFPMRRPPLTENDEKRLTDLFRPFREKGDPFVTQNPGAYRPPE